MRLDSWFLGLLLLSSGDYGSLVSTGYSCDWSKDQNRGLTLKPGNKKEEI